MPAREIKIVLFIALVVFILIESIVPTNGLSSSDEVWETLVRKAAQAGDYGRALEYLRRIEVKRPNDPFLQQEKARLLTRLGQHFYQEKNYPQARAALLEALDLNPHNYPALKTLGETAYYSQHLLEAEDYWQKALILNPSDRKLASQLERLRKELVVERDLDFSRLANFDIRFHAGKPDYDIYDIQSYLLDAYREIGYDFNFYPTRSIVVILYTRKEFEHLRNTPQWVGGIYDGKIRLPVGAGELSASDFKKILWHEYSHALVHDLTGNNCPRWLNEGLAQYEEAKVEPINLNQLRLAWEEETLLSLSELNRAFGFKKTPKTVALAYAQAYSLTDYLIRRYGFWRINLILQRLKQGEDWQKVFKEDLIISITELEEEWHQEIEREFGG